MARRMAPIDRVDFRKLHRALALSPRGSRVWVYGRAFDNVPSGGIVVTESQEAPPGVFEGYANAALLRAWGPDECDGEHYGGAGIGYNEDTGKWIYLRNRRPVGDGSWKSVVRLAIRNDWYWGDLYNQLREDILEQWGE